MHAIAQEMESSIVEQEGLEARRDGVGRKAQITAMLTFATALLGARGG